MIAPRRPLAMLALALVGCSSTGPPAPPPVPATRPVAVAPADTGYRPPLSAPIADGFRLPATAWGAGNRGIEYATRPGQPVFAAGAGVVAFAGSVAGAGVVSIDHPDGLRTTYTHLGRVLVGAGRVLAGGDRIGVASDRLHFGVRLGSAYLDPVALLSAGRDRARLVTGGRDRGRPVGR